MAATAIVMGAGLGGMSAAFRLHEAGVNVRVLEKEDRVGGRTSTIERDGFRIDRAASLFANSYEALSRLVRDAGLADQLVPASELLAIHRDGRNHPLRASSKLDAVRTSALSWRGKLSMIRVLRDLTRMKADLDWYDLGKAAKWDTESSADYARRRGLHEVLDYVIDPAVQLLTLSNPEETSVVDFFFGFAHVFGRSFFNSAKGVDFVCRGIAEHIEVITQAQVVDVEESAAGIEVTWVDPSGVQRVEAADYCVLSGSAGPILQVYPGLDATRRKIMEDIRYSKGISVHAALAARPAEKAMFIQVPGKESSGLTGVILDHNKAEGRAPEGKGLLTGYFGDAWTERMWERPDEEICAAGIELMTPVVPELAKGVEFAMASRWDPAVVISRPGGYSDIAKLNAAAEPTSRVQLAGDFATVSLTNSSCSAGELAAQRIVDQLG